MKLVQKIITILNFTLIGLLSARIIYVDNDKGPSAFILGYGLILIVNAIAWGILAILKLKLAKPYGRLIWLLLVLFIPLLILVTSF